MSDYLFFLLVFSSGFFSAYFHVMFLILSRFSDIFIF